MKKKIYILLTILAILIVVTPFVYFKIMLNITYSEGDRVGYVQKLSEKGWLVKTWEGELVMAAVPGSVPEKFLFTASDEKAAKEINLFLGKKAKLHYEQHKGLPKSLYGDTEYFVVSAKPSD